MFCPKCGKQYDEEQNFCRYCGYELSAHNNEINQNENSSITDKVTEITSSQENAVKELESELNAVDLTINAENDNQEELNQSVSDNQQKENPHANVDFDKYSQQDQKLTPKAYIVIGIVLFFLFALASLLWSVDVETQINPSSGEFHDDFNINTPSDEDRTYTREPAVPEKEEEPVADIPQENEQVQKEIMEQTQTEQNAEAPIQAQYAQTQEPKAQPTKVKEDTYAPVTAPVTPKPSEE